MYLDAGTLIAIIIAITTSTSLMITAVVQNARLARQSNEWRYQYAELKHYIEQE